MSSIPRIHCHSAFKHYQMFHSNYESSYGNSVFNTTYNFNGGSICGGGFLGGLFGGLGMGLGAGLMSWLGGGMGMFGGGFPMMNMFGGGFNMFGGGFPMMNMWGGGGVSDGAGGKSKAKSKDDDNNNATAKCGGKDAEYLHTLREKFNNIKKSSDPGKAALDLLNDINAVIATQKDDEHNDIDENNYKDLKADLEKEWKFELDKDGKAIKAEPKNAAEPAEPAEPTQPTQQVQEAAPENPVQQSQSSAEEAVELTLHFARHNGSKINDKYIKGKVIGIKMAADGKTPTGYIIDCSSEGSFKLKYEVTINNGIYNIRCISRTHSTKDCKKTLYTPADGIKYKKDENGELVRLIDDGEPLVSEHFKDGYQTIEYSETEDDTEIPDDYEEVDENGEAEINGQKVKVKA